MSLFHFPWKNNARIALFLLATSAPVYHASASLSQTANLGQSASFSQAALNTLFHYQDLHLETYLNGYPTGKILALKFVQGRIYMAPSELNAIGIPVSPDLIGSDGLVYLLDIPSLFYNLEQDRQLLFVNIDPKQLNGQFLNAKGNAGIPAPYSGFGSVLNYDVFAMRQLDSRATRNTTNVSSFLDFRLFGSRGLFAQTGIVRNGQDENRIRLDSYWSYTDVDAIATYRLGDTVSGGLAWSRPVRMAGFQVQRNFSVRPDLVTFPVPQASGTAAVPSTLDVYINNVRRYSEDVQAGPYVIDNLPVITGYGEARLVLRDALGREQVSTLPFYAAPSLLVPGLWDFSIEAGFLRGNYGAESNDYEDEFSFLGTARYGYNDYLTFEGHTETNENIFNIGFGSSGILGSFGVVSAGLAVSNFRGDKGEQLSLGYHYSTGQFSFQASTRQASDMYADLATAMGSATAAEVNQIGVSYTAKKAGSFGLSLIDIAQNNMQAFTGQPVGNCSGRISCIEPIRGESRLATFSYSRQLKNRMALFGSAFKDIQNNKNGISLGLSFPLGESVYSVADIRSSEDGNTATFQAFQSIPFEGTGFGWRMRKSVGEQSLGSAAVGYRGGNATVEVGANDYAGDSEAFMDLRGSAVALSGDLFLSNTIFDSFAVADVGTADVTVLHENRAVGRTNKNGRYLVTGLNAYHANKIGIDPLDLSVDYQPAAISRVAVPHDRAGLLVDLKVKKSMAATVIFHQDNGEVVPVGTVLELDDDDKQHVIGYDGLAFINDLQPLNSAILKWEDTDCRVEFAYEATPGALTRIGPVVCEVVSQ